MDTCIVRVNIQYSQYKYIASYEADLSFEFTTNKNFGLVNLLSSEKIYDLPIQN